MKGFDPYEAEPRLGHGWLIVLLILSVCAGAALVWAFLRS